MHLRDRRVKANHKILYAVRYVQRNRSMRCKTCLNNRLSFSPITSAIFESTICPIVRSSVDINITIQKSTRIHMISTNVYSGRHAHWMAASRQEVLLRRIAFLTTRFCPFPEHVLAVPVRERLHGKRPGVGGVADAGGNVAASDSNFATCVGVAA